MADLIDRQAALDAIMGQPPEPHYPSWYAAQIEELPAVQPATNCSEIPNSSTDCISRQAAIDALHTWFRDGFDEDKWWNSTHVLAAIEGLPSAQQEYKWETCFECPLSHGCPKIKGCTNGQAIEYASQIPNDCTLSAQPEQRWIPCSERLPYAEYGESDNVLATCGYRDVEDGSIRWIKTLYFNGGNWCHPTGETYLEKVYAWMPLPEPYRGGEKE